MKAARYSSYKPGQSKNIRLLPAHWAELPLKRLFRLEKREPLGSDEIVTAFRDGTVTLRKNRREEGFTNALKEIGYQRIHRDDLVIHAMDAFAGAIGVSDSDGKSSPVYSACTATKDASPHFYAYYLRDLALHGFIESLAKGIRERSTDFRWSDASMVAVPVPPRSEQLAIANFLDRETAKIDALIAEQQRLIELLQEKRQAVISHAVTKGLNPNAPMKDSGVEWLGEVPEHWEVMGLTKTIGPVVDYRGKTPTKCDSGTLLVTAKNIRNGEIDYTLSEEYVDPLEAEQLLQRGRPVIGDVLFTMEAPLGQVALVDREDMALAQRVVKFRGMSGRMTNDFLMWWLVGSPCQHQLNSLSTGSTALGIKASKLSAVTCVVPPLEEQMEISERIRDLTKQIAGIYSTATSQIDLLQERRSALISAAVTGQIDVQGLVKVEACEQ